MPWMETCIVDERERFVREALGGRWSIAELCRGFGISRKTGHKWLNRYHGHGVSGLADRSRARHSQSHSVSDGVRELIIQARRSHRTWGPKKLRPWLEREHPGIELPSLTTMATILRDAKLTSPQRRRNRLDGGTGGLGGDDHPNGVWATDFKGQFRLGDGRYCYPLTVTDSSSRYLLCCRCKDSTRGKPVQDAFVRLFQVFGVPEKIRSDNGSPFASRGNGRLTKLSVFWLDQGIALQRITPGRPQENGRHERMHLTLKRETTMPSAATMRSQQHRFDVFRHQFNEERPHEALGQTCPSEHYVPSSRVYNRRPAAAEYPGHYEVRSVRTDGRIKFHGQFVYVSEALVGRRVGLIEIDDGLWNVSYRSQPLGTLNQREDDARLSAPTRPGAACSRSRP